MLAGCSRCSERRPRALQNDALLYLHALDRVTLLPATSAISTFPSACRAAACCSNRRATESHLLCAKAPGNALAARRLAATFYPAACPREKRRLGAILSRLPRGRVLGVATAPRRRRGRIDALDRRSTSPPPAKASRTRPPGASSPARNAREHAIRVRGRGEGCAIDRQHRADCSPARTRLPSRPPGVQRKRLTAR